VQIVVNWNVGCAQSVALQTCRLFTVAVKHQREWLTTPRSVSFNAKRPYSFSSSHLKEKTASLRASDTLCAQLSLLLEEEKAKTTTHEVPMSCRRCSGVA